MPYAKIAALVIAISAIFGAGFKLSSSLSAPKILKLENAIALSNAKADALLDAAIAQKQIDETKAQQLNQQIETAHDQAIQTANALTDRISTTAGRLYTATRNQNCPNAVPGNPNATIAGRAAADEFRAEIARLSGEIGKTDAYAQACWKFVAQGNCGIATHQQPRTNNLPPEEMP